MPVRHRFVYRWPNGVTPVTFDTWVQSLTEDEKLEFLLSKQRQIEYRKQAINQDRMIVENGTYVWRDEMSARKNKPTDEIWYRYFKRYLNETQTEFILEEEIC
jgi:hypothetical protein